MLALVIALQVGLPVALLMWVAIMPTASRVGFVAQALSVAAILYALALVAQWAIPGWWLPGVFGGIWLVLVVAFVIRGGFAGRPSLPGHARGWLVLLFSLTLLSVGAWYSGRAWAGRSLASVEVFDIRNPFRSGKYLVGHGGSNILVNEHMRTLDTTVERFRAWRGQSYAVDFFGRGSWGLRARGWRPSDPADYAIFGAPLVAPCDGIVVAAANDMADLQVPHQDAIHRLGNHVILRCGEAEVVLAHMRRGSVTVARGDRVTNGDPIGEVGNSGASSEPHLHIHAQRPAAVGAPPISGVPLALRIDGRFLVRGDRFAGRSE